jgi:FAD/FMN-containing dehydrogenase
MSQEEQLAGIVGADNVSDSPDSLQEYAADESFAAPLAPVCVARPKDAREVQQIVMWGNALRVPLIPVSSGPPHFRGDTVPSVDGAVIVDLRRMNRIVRVDPEHRVVLIEPGVTFQELVPRVREAGLRLNLPLLPRPAKSVVGSMLEREPVIMPKYHWDISDPLACTEVVYGSGDLFKTGSAAGPGTLEEQWEIGAAQNEAAGPMQADFLRLIQGAQGTMGIVTWATARCEHLPSIEEPYVAGSDRLADLLEFAHWLVRNRSADDCLVLNDANLARIMAGEGLSDYEALRAALPSWILFYTLSGTRYFPEDKVTYLQKDVAEVARRIGVEPARSLGGIAASAVMESLHEPPVDTHWKAKGGMASADIFFISICQRLEEQIDTMRSVAAESGYPVADLGVYLQPVVQAVNYHCEFTLFFDKRDAEQEVRMAELTEAAAATLADRGAFFSRPYGRWADVAYGRDPATVGALQKVKKIFDPNRVMNPGKLCY